MTILDQARFDSVRALGLGLATELAVDYVQDSATHVAAMRRAAETGDTEAVRLHAHTIKGTSANLGLEEMRQLAAAAEATAKDSSASLAAADRLEEALARARAALGVGMSER